MMRYLPHTDKERKEMLKVIGIDSVDNLFSDIPEELIVKDDNLFPNHSGEIEVENILKKLSSQNLTLTDIPSFIGGGAYHHHIPATVDHIVQRSEFLTSYTPYQPEISQGTLQYLFEFQTQVCLLTGMEIANASMYDGATACAEAVLMAKRINKRKKIILSNGLHPQYKDVTKTFLQYSDSLFIEQKQFFDDCDQIIDAIDNETSCVVLQNPSFFGELIDISSVSKACNDAGALLIVVITEIVSLGALKSPGELGADIVVAEGQSLGNPLNFGGPYLGLFATKKKFARQMPGRLVGLSSDIDGERGFVLTLSTREQHIRREKATSNICTNSGLCSLAFTVHLALLGESGIKKLAQINHENALILAEKLCAIPNVQLLNSYFFNEFTIKLPVPSDKLVETFVENKILAGIPLSRYYPNNLDFSNLLLVAATELTSKDDIDIFVRSLKEYLNDNKI